MSLCGVQENRKIKVLASRSDSFSPIKDGDEVNEEDQRGINLASASYCTC
jgi:hypothetical protein